MKKQFFQGYVENSGDIPVGAPVIGTDGTIKVQAADGANVLVTSANINTVLSEAGIKNNFAATLPPTVSSDSAGGYTVGSRWIDTTAGESYICTDAAVGAAVWSKTTVGTIGEVSGLQDALDAKASIKAPIVDYSASATYAVGDQVIQDKKLYECKTAIATGETFTASKWDEISPGAAGVKSKTIHVLNTNIAIKEATADHNTGEFHFEGTGNLTILNTDVTTDTFGFTVINTDAGATRTLTPTGFAGVFKRAGGTNTDLGNVAFDIADNEKYRFTVTLSGTDRYLNIEDLNPPAALVSGNTIKTVNGASVLGSGDIVIAPTTVSSTVPTHDLDLVDDNYAGRTMHLRPDGMTATTNLATWSDSSSGGINAVQATAAKQPDVVESVLNGKPVVRFDGVDDVMTFSRPIGASGMILAVATPSSAANAYMISGNSAGDKPAILANYGFGTWEWFAGNNRNNIAPAGTTGTHIIAVAWQDGGTVRGYLDGVETFAVAQSGNLNGLIFDSIGATNVNAGYFGGDIAETLVFNSVLALAERQKVEGYLASKFNLQANLPVDHPYKTNPPQAGDLPTYADNAAASTANLPIGSVYMSADGLLRVRF